MKCKTCGKEFENDWRKQKKGEVQFCSSSCSRSRPRREVTKEEREVISRKNKEYWEKMPPEEKDLRLQLWRETRAKRLPGFYKKGLDNLLHYSEKLKQSAKIRIEKYLAAGGIGSLREAHIGSVTFRRYVLTLLGEKCWKCGLQGYWQDLPLGFHVHHYDGDANNNDVSNLRVLCPNCHSQTENFGAKNYKRSARNFAL